MANPGDPERRTVAWAGTYHQFRNWCREHYLNPNSRQLILVTDYHSAQKTRGLDGSKTDLVLIGTYYETREAADIEDTLRLGRFTFPTQDIPPDRAEGET